MDGAEKQTSLSIVLTDEPGSGAKGDLMYDSGTLNPLYVLEPKRVMLVKEQL